MPVLPELPYTTDKAKSRTVQFMGYSNDPVIQDGEMREMLNLSCDEYPYLTQRPSRGVYDKHYDFVHNIYTWKDKLVVVAEKTVYYDGQPVGVLKTEGEKQIAPINTKLCFFPDKVYLDSNDMRIHDMEASVSGSATIDAEKQTITIEGADLSGFKAGDAVTVDGINEQMSLTISAVEKSTFTLPDSSLPTDTPKTAEKVTVTRNVPDIDFCVSVDNRVWGCKGSSIYSSKLGDPTNWNYFQGLSNDSYAVEVSSDGDFTGCSNFSNHILFFKEHYIHKLYGSNKPSTYQIITIEGNGLESGSHKSVINVDGVLYYKSPIGIMAYSGGYPAPITTSFRKAYRNCAGGTTKMKYYLSMQGVDDGVWDMFVYDFSRKIWHKEDHTHATCFTYVNGRLMYYDEGRDGLFYVTTDGSDADPADKHIPWNAQFGEFSESVENKKIYSRIEMRYRMERGADMTIFIATDDGDWKVIAHIRNSRGGVGYIPFRPERCDKFRIRLEGRGRCRIESLVRVVREGGALG